MTLEHVATRAPRHPDLPPGVVVRGPDLDAARTRFGDIVDRYAACLTAGDPAADALVAELNALPPGRGAKLLHQALDEGIARVHRPPPALVAFFAQVDEVPLWVDWDQLALGGSVLLRAGPLAGLVLACYALPMAYASPRGNKPLVLSGKLVDRAFRRLSETARYVVEVCRKDGLRRTGAGFRISIRVRLMHAQIRRLLLRSDAWKLEWGLPINQVDMAATTMLFSFALLDGLRKLGLRFSNEEIEATIQLWRYAGLLMGVDPNLCVATLREGTRLSELLVAINGSPDADSQRLIQALIRIPETLADSPATRAMAPRLIALEYAVSRRLIGHELADRLGYPRTSWRHALRPLWLGLFMVSVGQRMSSRSRKLAAGAGLAVWEHIIERGLAGLPASFPLPRSLAGAARDEEGDGTLA
jgi:hypothetical protein